MTSSVKQLKSGLFQIKIAGFPRGFTTDGVQVESFVIHKHPHMSRRYAITHLKSGSRVDSALAIVNKGLTKTQALRIAKKLMERIPAQQWDRITSSQQGRTKPMPKYMQECLEAVKAVLKEEGFL